MISGLRHYIEPPDPPTPHHLLYSTHNLSSVPCIRAAVAVVSSSSRRHRHPNGRSRVLVEPPPPPRRPRAAVVIVVVASFLPSPWSSSPASSCGRSAPCSCFGPCFAGGSGTCFATACGSWYAAQPQLPLRPRRLLGRQCDEGVVQHHERLPHPPWPASGEPSTGGERQRVRLCHLEGG